MLIVGSSTVKTKDNATIKATNPNNISSAYVLKIILKKTSNLSCDNDKRRASANAHTAMNKHSVNITASKKSSVTFLKNPTANPTAINIINPLIMMFLRL